MHAMSILIGQRMTFGLVRCGWPNSAAIAALALLPLAALVMEASQQQRDARPTSVEIAGHCPADNSHVAALTTSGISAAIQ